MIHGFEEKMEKQNRIISKITKYIESENNPQILRFFVNELSKIIGDLDRKINIKLDRIIDKTRGK